MKKQIKVVMLPTEKASTIAIIANKLAHNQMIHLIKTTVNYLN